MYDTHDAHFTDAQADYVECMQWARQHNISPNQGRGIFFETPDASLAAKALAGIKQQSVRAQAVVWIHESVV